MGFLRHYERLQSEVEGFLNAQGNNYTSETHILYDSNFNVAFETGIRYPTLPAMQNRGAMLVLASVRSILLVVPCYPGLSHIVSGISKLITTCAEHKQKLKRLCEA